MNCPILCKVKCNCIPIACPSVMAGSRFDGRNALHLVTGTHRRRHREMERGGRKCDAKGAEGEAHS